MSTPLSAVPALDSDPQETWEWREALNDVLHCDGPRRCTELLTGLLEHARRQGVTVHPVLNTRYCNTIARPEEPPIRATLNWKEKSPL